MRIGAAKTEAGRAFGFVQIQIPAVRQPVTRESFRFSVDKSKLKEAELRDGHYLLCSNVSGEDPVWPENPIRRIPSSTKGYISVRNFGICTEIRLS